MDSRALSIALIAYAGVAIGGIPGLAVDRTGIALLGAIAMVAGGGLDIRDYVSLTVISAGLSNLVSNVPATMLLTKFLDPAVHTQWYVLALSSTLAGNLITIGSIATLITIEQAKEFGIQISFREHAAVGVPVTLASLVITLLWIKVLY